jgi:hypothetical protein
MQLRHVPVDEAEAGAPFALGFRHPKVIANGDAPGSVDDAPDRREEAFRQTEIALLQLLVEGLGVERGN